MTAKEILEEIVRLANDPCREWEIILIEGNNSLEFSVDQNIGLTVTSDSIEKCYDNMISEMTNVFIHHIQKLNK